MEDAHVEEGNAAILERSRTTASGRSWILKTLKAICVLLRVHFQEELAAEAKAMLDPDEALARLEQMLVPQHYGTGSTASSEEIESHAKLSRAWGKCRGTSGLGCAERR